VAYDPIAALRPVEVDVQLGGWEYTIPALPASAWIRATLEADGGAIVPGLLAAAQDRSSIWTDYARGDVSKEEIAEAARDALEAVAGRPWWEASRLITGAAHQDAWAAVSGELFARGVDLDKMSLGAFLNAVYATAVRNGTKEEREKLDFELKRIPPEVGEEAYDEAEEEAAFMRDFGGLGG
jgi:hypothetical protein